MPLIEFAGQSARDPDSRAANSSRLINCHREKVGGRTDYVLRKVLGMVAFTSVNAVFCRAMHWDGTYIFAAVGGYLWRISSDGTTTSIGAIIDSAETTIASNNGILTVTAGGTYYNYDGATLTTPGTGAFSDMGSLTFIGQRTVITERGGRRFQWSDVADATTLGGSFATTESRDDNNLRVLAHAGILWFFKERSIERWYEDATDVFAPVSGGTIDVGLKSYGLICKTPAAVFFVGSDGKAYLVGSEIKPVSNVAVETAIEQGTPDSCFYYRDEGHEFVCIHFEDRPAWVFDLSALEWHERAEGLDLGPWSATQCVEAWNGDFITGNTTGSFNQLARVSNDIGEPLISQATGHSIRVDGNRFRVAKAEVFGKLGVSSGAMPVILQIAGLEVLDASDGGALLILDDSGIARDPKVMLEVSRDYGITFGEPKVRSLGVPGDYDITVRWRSLGQFRSFTPRLSWADNTDITIDATMSVALA